MYKPRTPQTPEQNADRQKRWADYMRRRNRPTKQCRVCFQYFPNDDKNFAKGTSGILRSTCWKCAETQAVSMKSRSRLLRGGRHAMCPMCDEHKALVVARSGSQPELLCHRCNALLVHITKFPRLTRKQVFERLWQKLEQWDRKK